MELTAKQLADILRGTVDGDPEVRITTFAKIEHGKPGALSFYANPKYEQYVYTSKSSILLVNSDFVPKQEVGPTMVRSTSRTSIACISAAAPADARSPGAQRWAGKSPSEPEPSSERIAR